MKTNGKGHAPGVRGRRYKLNANGDVFLFRARPDDGSWEPLTRLDDEQECVLLQFHNVEDATSFVKKTPMPELAGATIIIAEVRRQFVLEAEQTTKIRIKERKRVVADLKTERKIPVVVNVEKENGEAQEAQ